MGTDYVKISSEAIGEEVEVAGLFQPAGGQYSSARAGGNAAGGIVMALSKHSDRTKSANEANLPQWMILAVTASQVHVFEAKQKIGHYEIAGPAFGVFDRSSLTAEKHLGGLEAEGLSLTSTDGKRLEVEAPRLSGHGTDVIKLLAG